MEQPDDTQPYPETADIETSTDDYAQRFAGPSGRWMLSVQEKYVLQFMSDLKNAKVLDVGGGHGQTARPLVEQGFDVTVLGSADICRARIADLVDAGQCRYLTGNVIALPFEDNAFDVVLSVRLLPHCEQWPVLLKEMSRVARHHVIVDYPALSLLNRLAPWLFALKKKLEGNTRTWISFRHAQVRETFSEFGMHVSGREAQFFWPMVLHRKLKSPAISRALESVPRLLGLTRAFGSPIVLKASVSSGNHAADAPQI